MKGGVHDERPYFSICIPTYNRAHMIGETIDSILAQTFEDFELVVVDDASTDHTKEIIEAYQRNDFRIRYLASDENLGHIAANNRCYVEARGEIIYIFDSDDLMNCDNLQARYDFWQEHPEVGLLYSDASVIDEHGQILAKSFWKAEGYEPLRGKLNAKMIALFGLFAPHCGWCIRREVFESLGPQPIEIGYSHDAYYLLRAAGMFEIDYIDRQLVRYRKHQATITSQKTSTLVYGRVEGLRRLFEEFPQVVSRRKMNFFMSNHCARAGLVDVEKGNVRRARRYFREALALCPYHLSALLWYCNTFIGVRAIWEFKCFKKWYLHLSGLGYKRRN